LFYDTVKGRFVSVGGEQTWKTFDEFEEIFHQCGYKNKSYTIDRFKSIVDSKYL